MDEESERPFYLPPIQPKYGYSDLSQVSSRYSSKEKVYLPKTFTTRKGALLLFSEDMAHRTRQTEAKRHRHTYREEGSPEDSTLSDSSIDRDLKTVDDLARCILSYGSHFGHVSAKIDSIFRVNVQKFCTSKFLTNYHMQTVQTQIRLLLT